MSHNVIDTLLGGAFVLYYSGRRFNTPSTNRSSTTWGRFFPGLLAYCLIALAMYLVLVFLGSDQLLQLLAAKQVDPELQESLSNPLLVALLVTVLLPKLPYLSAIDEWICKQLQTIAAIPHEVRRLSAALGRQLGNACFSSVPNLQESVRQKLRRSGIDDRDIRFTGEMTPAREWTVLTALLVKVEEWSGDRKMAGYFVEYDETWDRLSKRHQALNRKAITCLGLLRETDASGRERDGIQQLVDDFSEQVASLREDLLAFVSRGILHADLTDGARSRRLAALGFTIVEQPTVTVNQMMSLFALLLALILTAYVVVWAVAAQRVPSRGMLLGRAVMISLIYLIAVACAVFPKQRWAFARREPGKPRPGAFYILAPLIAVAIGSSIGFLYHLLMTQSFGDAARRWLLTYPWAVQTFTLTLVTAVLLDTVPPPSVPKRLFRAIEGLFAATAMMVAAAFTVEWLVDRAAAHPDYYPGYQVSPLAQALIMAGGVGFMVGFLVPTWWRALRPQPELLDAAPRPALTA